MEKPVPREGWWAFFVPSWAVPLIYRSGHVAELLQVPDGPQFDLGACLVHMGRWTSRWRRSRSTYRPGLVSAENALGVISTVIKTSCSSHGYLMKIHFGTKKVQKMGRVALTEALLRNAGIQEGDSVDLYFDATTKAIIIERTPSTDAAEASVSAKPTKKKTRTP